MIKKCLLLGLAVMLLMGLGGAAVCGKANTPGRYVNEDD